MLASWGEGGLAPTRPLPSASFYSPLGCGLAVCPSLTLTSRCTASGSLPEPGWEQAVCAIGRERKPKREAGGGDAGLAERLLLFSLFPQPWSQGQEVWAGGGSGRAPKNRQSQPFPGGPGVRPPPHSICLCCSLCHPACQPSPAQASRLRSQAVPATARIGVGVGCSAGSVKGSAALFDFSVAPLCLRSSGLSQPWGSDSALCQSLAVSSVPASLPPPARGLLPALGSGSIRPCQPQLLHTPLPTPGLKAGSPSIRMGLLSALAAPGPGSPTLFPTPPFPHPSPQ